MKRGPSGEKESIFSQENMRRDKWEVGSIVGSPIAGTVWTRPPTVMSLRGEF